MVKQIERVFIIGMDGVGNFIKDTATPNLHSLLENGVLTYQAQTVYPTISAECWGSTLHGVSPEKHGLNNDVASTRAFPEDSPYPSIFKLMREAKPESKLAAFSVWDPINSGIIEQSADVYLESQPDDALVASIVNYIKEEPPVDLMYVQLDAPDGAGHQYGYGSEAYLESITACDVHVGEIVQAITDAHLLDSSLIILLADHGGGGDNLYAHGSDQPQDMTIFWGCHGPGVNTDVPLTDGFSIMNTAAIALEALGIDIPQHFEGKVPAQFFKND